MDIFDSGFRLLLIVVALVAWKLIFFPSTTLLASRINAFLWLAFIFACAIAIDFVLAKWSSPSVRGDASEVNFYLIFAVGWISIAQAVFALLGISVRDDVAERRNAAAGFACVGWTLAATCCVAGANIGDGPGFGVVLFCAALATAILCALWFLVAAVSGAVETITIERDDGSGIRCGGWLAGTGITAGACVAGDWISLSATVRDFAKYFWPLVIVAGIFAIIERSLCRRPFVERLGRSASVGIASLLVILGGWYANWIGRH
jgi:hypothetical protein